jgi:hypothetical protein
MNSMKNLISIFLLSLLINFKSFGQGNLVFNNTIYKEFSHYNPGTTGLENVGTFTVPAGKVWKIESILNSYDFDPVASPGANFSGAGSWSIKKQGGNVFHTIKQGDAAQSDIIWLNTGSYELNLYKTPSSNYRFNLLLTGIEFNLVP